MPSFFRLLRPSGFTLIEVLIALAILLIVLVVLMQFMTGVDAAWKSAAADPFAEAQDAFEIVAHHLAAATLAPYEDYADGSGVFRTSAAFVPDHLARRSDLDFVCGPGAGTNGLLTASGRITSGSSVFFELDWFQQLIALRRDLPALHSGAMRWATSWNSATTRPRRVSSCRRPTRTAGV
jgi:prepilin-type N-terminal cleavage/methylation domain-containing protein